MNFFVFTTVMTPFLFVIVSVRYTNILVLFGVPTVALSLPYFKMGGNYAVSCYLCEQIFMKKSNPITGLEWPRGFQEVKVPRFRYNGTG